MHVVFRTSVGGPRSAFTAFMSSLLLRGAVSSSSSCTGPVYTLRPPRRRPAAPHHHHLHRHLHSDAAAAPERRAFSRLVPEDLAFFRDTLPEGGTVTDPDLLEAHNVDWLKSVRGAQRLYVTV